MPAAFAWTARFGPDTVMLECLQQLEAEVAACVGMLCFDGTIFAPTNLGQIGDPQHQAEPTSMHNPQPCPDGVWRVMAADWGGTYRIIALFLQAMAKAGDLRMVPFGFAQRGDGYGLQWGSWDWKWTGKDQGHAHGNTTLATQYPRGLASYNAAVWAAITSRRPWGLASFLATGRLGGTIQGDIDMGYATRTPDDKQALLLDMLGMQAATPAGMKPLSAVLYQEIPSDLDALLAQTGDRAVFASTTGDPTVWLLLGAGRVWVSPIAFEAMGSPSPRRLSIAHPYFALPVIGAGPEPVRYLTFPDDPTSIFRVVGGVRQHLSLSKWTALGKPRPTPTGALDPAATYATV